MTSKNFILPNLNLLECYCSNFFPILVKGLSKKYFDNDIPIDLIFPLQQQQAPPSLNFFTILVKELSKKYFDNDILIGLIFPLQQQQAPPINSISTAAVTSTNSISPNPTAATATLPDQKQIQGKMSCQKQSNGFSTFHVTFVRLPREN